MEALRIYTMGSAWLAFADDDVGSIEVGKLADLVVLSDDYLAVADTQLRSIHSVMTIVGGTIVFSDVEGFPTYGCGSNPPGSLITLSGAPILGSTWTLGVDNPLGTQPAGSVAILVVTPAADRDFPCGTLLPGFGMTAPGTVGELLLDLDGANTVLGPITWNGMGNHASFAIPIPVATDLVGAEFFLQGAVADLGGTSGIPVGLTEALAVRIR
jgi:hypothetical protein